MSAVELELGDIIEECSYAIAVAIRNNNPDPNFEVYEHDALHDIGNNGCLLTLYEYDISPELGRNMQWRLRYGVMVFGATQAGLITDTNLVIQAIERPFPTERIGYIQAKRIHAVTDYYKSTSRQTNIVFDVVIRLRRAAETTHTIDSTNIEIAVKGWD